MLSHDLLSYIGENYYAAKEIAMSCRYLYYKLHDHMQSQSVKCLAVISKSDFYSCEDNATYPSKLRLFINQYRFTLYFYDFTRDQIRLMKTNDGTCNKVVFYDYDNADDVELCIEEENVNIMYLLSKSVINIPYGRVSLIRQLNDFCHSI